MKAFGTDHIPRRGPFILACNHISYFDPPLVGSMFSRPLHFMAKKELFGNRFFGWILKSVNAFPVSRRGVDRAAITRASEILAGGGGLLIFPEGTRAREGRFLKARPGIGMIAAESGVPVIPCYVQGLNRPGDCFWGRLKAGVICGQPLEVAGGQNFDDGGEGYRALADEIMNRIKELKKEFNAYVKGRNMAGDSR